MFESGYYPGNEAHAEDRDQLVRFEKSLMDCRIRLLNALAEFDAQLSRFMAQLCQKRDYIRKELEAAQETLDNAESKLYRCLDSQHEDEEGHLTPSCSWERDAVDGARRIRDAWQDRYERAQRIIQDCEIEVDEYNFTGGVTVPPGAREKLRNAAEEYTDEALAKLSAILDAVDATLSMPMNIDKMKSHSFTPENSEERIANVEEKDEDDQEILDRRDILIDGLTEVNEKINDDIEHSIRTDAEYTSRNIVERFKEGSEKIKEKAEEAERVRILKRISDDNDERGARERERMINWFNSQNQR